MLGSLGALHALGCAVDWKTLHPAARAVRLPSYAWREEQYWHEAVESRESRLGASPHPFLARRITAADPTWQTRLDLQAAPSLKDHLVQEHIVFPGAGYVEMALGAGKLLFGEAQTVIEEMDFQKALVLNEADDAARIQFCLSQQDSTFTISSRAGTAGEAWTVNSIGKIRACPEAELSDAGAPESLDIASAQQVGSDVIYRRFRELGLPYGPMFRCIETAWRRDGEVLGRVQLPSSLERESAAVSGSSHGAGRLFPVALARRAGGGFVGAADSLPAGADQSAALFCEARREALVSRAPCAPWRSRGCGRHQNPRRSRVAC